MAFYPLDKLKKGDTSFLGDISETDIETIIKSIRFSKSKNDIIKAILFDRFRMPNFILKIIYDNPAFSNYTIELLTKTYTKITPEMIPSFITNTAGALEYLYDNIQTYKDYNNLMYYIISSAMDEENYNMICKFAYIKDLHLRSEVMKVIIEHYYNSLEWIYPDITKAFIGYAYEEGEQLDLFVSKMDEKDLSRICVSLLDNCELIDLFKKVKDYLLENYKKNHLTYYLLYGSRLEKREQTNRTNYISEFIDDANTLFKTSECYGKLFATQKYQKYIEEEMVKDFLDFTNIYDSGDKENFRHIMANDLGDILIELTNKYLSLSTDKTCQYIGCGSTSSCYRIGDYVIKLNRTKWSYEDVICPNLYLIIKNEEEYLIRDKSGIVIAGIEVQKYLKKSIKEISREDESVFRNALLRQGYYLADNLVFGSLGNNCGLLDSYLDADTQNPEELPEEFKKLPLVLIDRDLVFDITNKNPKRLRSASN